MSEKKNYGITLNDLLVEVYHLVKDGYGDKHIQIVDDDEGNGWHTLWNGFIVDKESIGELTEHGAIMHDRIPLDEIVLLG